MTHETVLHTVHGSHLYGLAHEDSDYDTYRVVVNAPKKYAAQGVSAGGLDATVMHLDRFLAQLYKGVPQAVEAYFSRFAWVHPHYAPFIAAHRLNSYQVYDTYRRTALNIGLSGDGYKSRRHAVRLAVNLLDFVRHGWFDPTLDIHTARWIGYAARLEGEAFEGMLRDLLRSVHD